MRIVPIADVFDLSNNEAVPSIIGRVSEIYELQSGETKDGKWSLQNLTLTDRGGKAAIKVKLKNRNPLDPREFKGKTICLSCNEGDKGLTGVKAKDDDYRGKTSRILWVTGTAHIEFVDAELDHKPDTGPAQDPRNTQRQQPDPRRMNERRQPESQQRQEPAEPPQQSTQRQTTPQTPAQATQPPPQNGHATSQNGHANGNAVPPGSIRMIELRYDRTVNTGNYNNEKIGVTLAINEGVKAADALALARKFIDSHIAASAVSDNG